MKTKVLLGAVLLAVSLPALALTAILVSTRYGTSVSGQSIVICTYTVNGQQFERYYPVGSVCPPSVNVQ